MAITSPEASTQYAFRDDFTRRAAVYYAAELFPGSEEGYPVQSEMQPGQIPVEYGYNSNAVAEALRRNPGQVLILMNRVTRFECSQLLAQRSDVRVEEFRD